MRCDCGKRIYLGEIPCPYEWNFISDSDLGQFFSERSKMIDGEKLYLKMNSFVKCPECGSLWLFWDGDNSKAQKFKPES